MLSIFSVLSETSRRSHLVHPLLSCTYDAEQTSVTSRHRPCWADLVTHVGD